MTTTLIWVVYLVGVFVTGCLNLLGIMRGMRMGDVRIEGPEGELRTYVIGVSALNQITSAITWPLHVVFNLVYWKMHRSGPMSMNVRTPKRMKYPDDYPEQTARTLDSLRTTFEQAEPPPSQLAASGVLVAMAWPHFWEEGRRQNMSNEDIGLAFVELAKSTAAQGGP